jgi:hypothetical protein
MELLNEYKEISKTRSLTPIDIDKMNELAERVKNTTIY